MEKTDPNREEMRRRYAAAAMSPAELAAEAERAEAAALARLREEHPASPVAEAERPTGGAASIIDARERFAQRAAADNTAPPAPDAPRGLL